MLQTRVTNSLFTHLDALETSHIQCGQNELWISIISVKYQQTFPPSMQLSRSPNYKTGENFFISSLSVFFFFKFLFLLHLTFNP